MQSWKKPTDKMLEEALSPAMKEVDRLYFFCRLKNPLWMQPMVERGYFSWPPQAKQLPDGSVQYPDWPEFRYLINVSKEAPQEVVQILLNLPKTDNARIYDGIIDIALKINGDYSSKLLPKILEYIDSARLLRPHNIADLILHWQDEKLYQAALTLSGMVIPFFRIR